ncbi:glycoside hydrolase family 20 protein [Schizophyllum fasciatum]
MHRTPRSLLALALLAPAALAGIWPQPRALTNGSSFLQLAPDFHFNVDIPDAPDDLHVAVDRTAHALQDTLIARLVVGRGARDEGAVRAAPALACATLVLEDGAGPARPIAEEAVRALGERAEGYSLYVPDDGGEAVISANSTLGLLRGLTTFEQLWYALGAVAYTDMAPVAIEQDAPAYPYRGFMLDTARNYFPAEDIKRTLRAMSFVKMSMFHWHIVDSQSFPLVLEEFPELAQTGAYGPDKVYSPDDVQDIVQYAAQLGIDVLVEIDMPGHTDIVGLAHPEWVACSQAAPWAAYAAEPPAGQLRFTTPAVVDFAAALVGAVARDLPSAYLSTGGDEVNRACYEGDEQFQRELNASGATFDGALDAFVQRVHGTVRGMAKTPVVWEEMVLDQNVALSNDTLVLVWISSEHAAKVAEKNLRIVHGPSDYFYLDCGGGGWVGNNPAGNSWCDPFKTWQHAYTFDPLANLTDAQAALVMGGQHLLWTEQTGPESLDATVWPRAATSAETFWTATQPDGSALDVDAALPRLHEVRYRLLARGVGARALQPEWCALRPFLCNLEA